VTRLAVLAAVGLACSRSPGHPEQPERAVVAPATAPSPPPPAAAPSPAPTTAAAGASSAPAPVAAPTASAAASPVATTPQPAAGPAALPSSGDPLRIPLTTAAASGAGGAQPLARDTVTVVEVGARFQVEVAVALQDARLSLQDRDGAMIPAAGGTEIGATWARFTLAPDAPLAPGSEYTLRLEGALRRTARDAEGRDYAPATWPLLTAGEKPPPEPRKAERRRR
jgi:hypothetical protein